MPTTFLLTMVIVCLGGCSTALLEPLFETEPPPPNAVLRQVTAASKTTSGETVSVCVSIADAAKVEKAYTFDIPIKDRNRWQIWEVTTLNKERRTYIDYEQTLADLRPGCTIHPIQLPLIQFEENLFLKQLHSNSGGELLKPQQGVSESFYLVNRYHLPVMAGYLSSEPLLANAYAVSVSLEGRFETSLRGCGQLLTIEERIDRGEDVNGVDSFNRWTALHCAAREGDVKRAKRLLENKAKVDARTDKGATPLFLASETTNIELVKLLIGNKANVNAISIKGDTPLVVAARLGYANIVQVLLENGADAKFKDPQGNTAWMWAERNKHEEVKAVLRECCAER